jgi:chemotaxis protein methyltransferase CheR
LKKLDLVERHLFLEGIYMKYGYDFRQYSEASFDRRLMAIIGNEKCLSLLQLLEKILQDKNQFRRILSKMTVRTTEFFRDPVFFKALREKVMPVLKTYPSLQIWVAGCSTGEELYSLAIVLREEGLLDRSTIFATDINPESLDCARSGIYDNRLMQGFTRNYIVSGGTQEPSTYYTSDYEMSRFDPTLRENTVFSEHNLATDGVFTECHLILCRNVLIYFNQDLQNRVFGLFTDSLVPRGFLGIGSKEDIRFSNVARIFDTIDSKNHFYQRRPRVEATTIRDKWGGHA